MTSTLRSADPCVDVHFDPDSDDARRMLDGILSTPRRLADVRSPRFGGRVLVAAGTVAAAGAVVVVSITTTSSHHRTEALGPAGYRVTTQSDGAIQVVVRWDEVRDPAALQASLDQAQAHTKIWVTDASVHGLWCRGVVHSFTGELEKDVIQYNNPGGASGLLIRPEKFPAGVTLLITVDVAGPGAPDVSPTGAPQTDSAPGGMLGYNTVWVTGATADCV